MIGSVLKATLSATSQQRTFAGATAICPRRQVARDYVNGCREAQHGMIRMKAPIVEFALDVPFSEHVFFAGWPIC
jgi:hypothetical protein